jgi:curved DNA-binding protein CbpA
MKYFANCKTLDELKREYRRLTMLHHPDRGGDTATMQAINAEHDEVFEVLKNRHNAQADEQHQTTEAPEEFRNIIEALLKLDGLEVELCGSWLWIGGNTRTHKDTLKAIGCSWSNNKKLWYWHHREDGSRWHRGKKTMSQIRMKYGSQSFGRGAGATMIGEVC